MNLRQIAVLLFYSEFIFGCAQPEQPVISATVTNDLTNQTEVNKCLAKFNFNKGSEFNKQLTKECFDLIQRNKTPTE